MKKKPNKKVVLIIRIVALMVVIISGSQFITGILDLSSSPQDKVNESLSVIYGNSNKLTLDEACDQLLNNYEKAEFDISKYIDHLDQQMNKIIQSNRNYKDDGEFGYVLYSLTIIEDKDTNKESIKTLKKIINYTPKNAITSGYEYLQEKAKETLLKIEKS